MTEQPIIISLVDLPDYDSNGRKETKKFEVTFKLGNDTHKLKFGAKDHGDYPYYLETRGKAFADKKRENFYKRFKKLMSKRGIPAMEDPLSSLYWSTRALW